MNERDYTPEYLASEAARLLKDEVLLEALSRINLEALQGLVNVDPSNTMELMRLQSMARVASEILVQLDAMILALDNSGGIPELDDEVRTTGRSH